MIKNCYAVYDIKMEAFQSPIFVEKDEAAKRMFLDLAKDKDTMVGAHPEDYQMFKIGYMDVTTGKLTDISPSKLIASAAVVVGKEVPHVKRPPNQQIEANKQRVGVK